MQDHNSNFKDYLILAEACKLVLLSFSRSFWGCRSWSQTCCCTGAVKWLGKVEPPKALWRTVAALTLGGQSLQRILQGLPSDYSPDSVHLAAFVSHNEPLSGDEDHPHH